MHKTMLPITLTLILSLVAFPSAGSAKKPPKAVWQVTRSTDPITGVTRCIVAAYDQAAGTSYSRTGALYPFVENSSAHGLLVGVSSGGRWRLPTGDVVWRVDDRPFHTLRAADNPVSAPVAGAPQGDTDVQRLVDQQMRIVGAVTATSTVASGEIARAMLAEMRAGQGLVYRAADTTVGYGLPTGTEQSVGLKTKGGIRPYPLDDSFRTGLTSCGIEGPVTG